MQRLREGSQEVIRRPITRRATTIAERRQVNTRLAITTSTLDDFEPIALENATRSGLSRSPMTNRATAPSARALEMGKDGVWRACFYWPAGSVSINVETRHTDIVWRERDAKIVNPARALLAPERLRGESA